MGEAPPSPSSTATTSTSHDVADPQSLLPAHLCLEILKLASEKMDHTSPDAMKRVLQLSLAAEDEGQRKQAEELISCLRALGACVEVMIDKEVASAIEEEDESVVAAAVEFEVSGRRRRKRARLVEKEAEEGKEEEVHLEAQEAMDEGGDRIERGSPSPSLSWIMDRIIPFRSGSSTSRTSSSPLPNGSNSQPRQQLLFLSSSTIASTPSSPPPPPNSRTRMIPPFCANKQPDVLALVTAMLGPGAAMIASFQKVGKHWTEVSRQIVSWTSTSPSSPSPTSTTTTTDIVRPTEGTLVSEEEDALRRSSSSSPPSSASSSIPPTFIFVGPLTYIWGQIRPHLQRLIHRQVSSATSPHQWQGGITLGFELYDEVNGIRLVSASGNFKFNFNLEYLLSALAEWMEVVKGIPKWVTLVPSFLVLFACKARGGVMTMMVKRRR